MQTRRKSFPPFAALRAFHTAACHGRFRDAASELGVTESAVSHQIRRLEDFLHIQLFDRNGPQIRLTPAGQRFFERIDGPMEQIHEATRAMLGPVERSSVALTLPPSLAIFWLIPKLGAFERVYPDIDLQLVTTTRVSDLRREQIDLAIRYGRGPWPDVEQEFLLAETAMPVCRPGYLPDDAENDVGAALATCRLIISGHHPDEWAEWAYAHGIEPPDLDGALMLESQEQVLEAAERGGGLAIGRRPLVDGRLASGALITPFGAPDPSPTKYYLCYPSGTTPTAAARRVAHWLREQAQHPPRPALPAEG